MTSVHLSLARCLTVSRCHFAEEQKKTLMECYPDSAMAGEYRTLAKQMYRHLQGGCIDVAACR